MNGLCDGHIDEESECEIVQKTYLAYVFVRLGFRPRYLPLRVYLAQFRPAFSGTRTSERDRVFADLLISTGMRINEANSLLLGDLPDPDAPECWGKKTIPLRLHRGTKGRKVRVIRIPVHVLRSVFRLSQKIVIMPLPCSPPVTVPRNCGCQSPADR